MQRISNQKTMPVTAHMPTDIATVFKCLASDADKTASQLLAELAMNYVINKGVEAQATVAAFKGATELLERIERGDRRNV